MKKLILVFLSAICLFCFASCNNAGSLGANKTEKVCVIFDYRDGITRNKALLTDYDVLIEKPNNPLRDGYSFSGWHFYRGTNPYDIVEWDFDQFTTKMSDHYEICLFAQWSPTLPGIKHDLLESGKEYVLKDNSETYVTFYPKVTGIYVFDFDACENISLQYQTEEIDIISKTKSLVYRSKSDNGKLYLHLQANKNHIFKLVNAGKEKTIDIKISTPHELHMGMNNDLLYTKELCYYAFRAPESGYYRLANETGKNYYIREAYTKRNEALSCLKEYYAIPPSSHSYFYLKENEAIHLAVQNSFDVENGTFWLEITKIDAPYQWVVDGKILEENILYLAKGSKVKLQLCINDEIVDATFQYAVSQDFSELSHNGELRISAHANNIARQDIKIFANGPHRLTGVFLVVRVIDNYLPIFAVYKDGEDAGFTWLIQTDQTNIYSYYFVYEITNSFGKTSYYSTTVCNTPNKKIKNSVVKNLEEMGLFSNIAVIRIIYANVSHRGSSTDYDNNYHTAFVNPISFYVPDMIVRR